MIRRTLSIAVAALVAFHVWVLGDQLREGALADPALAARWIVGGGLVWAAITFHRRGLSLWSRQAVAVWSLAALLHGPAILQRSTAGDPLLPQVAATVAQIAVVAAGLGLGILVAGLVARTRMRLGQPRSIGDWFSIPQVQLRAFVVLAPRPPPSA